MNKPEKIVVSTQELNDLLDRRDKEIDKAVSLAKAGMREALRLAINKRFSEREPSLGAWLEPMKIVHEVCRKFLDSDADRAITELVSERDMQWRRGLWVAHGHFDRLYGDDGEMQCGLFDFKRDPIDRLIEHTRRAIAELRESIRAELLAPNPECPKGHPVAFWKDDQRTSECDTMRHSMGYSLCPKCIFAHCTECRRVEAQREGNNGL